MNFMLNCQQICGHDCVNFFHILCRDIGIWLTYGVLIPTLFCTVIAVAICKYTNKEFQFLHEKASNTFDKIMVLIFSTFLGIAATWGFMILLEKIVPYLSYNEETKTVMSNVFNIHYERLISIYVGMITFSYALLMPKHTDLRLWQISDESAALVHHSILKIVIISYIIACIALIGVSFHSIKQTALGFICDTMCSILLCGYYFFIMLKYHDKIAQTFINVQSSDYSIAAKLTSFINNKFVFIALLGMIGIIINDYSLKQEPINFYQNIINIYEFIVVLYLVQSGLSWTINQFITRIEKLQASAIRRRKNLIWICDVTVMMLYFSIVSYILTFLNIQFSTYIFRSKIVGSALIVFISLMIYRAFGEFVEAYKECSFKSFLPILSIIFYFALFCITGLILLDNFGIETTPILATFATINLGISLAAKDIIQAFIQGIILLVEKDIQIGDVVIINDIKGVVEKISVRILTLRCSDGSLQVIPYNHVNIITNFSRGYNVMYEQLRVCDAKDVDIAINLLKTTASKLLQEPQYNNMTYGSIQIEGLAPFDFAGFGIKWSLMTTNTTISTIFRDELYFELHKAFIEKGIKLPTGTQYELITSKQ